MAVPVYVVIGFLACAAAHDRRSRVHGQGTVPSIENFCSDRGNSVTTERVTHRNRAGMRTRQASITQQYARATRRCARTTKGLGMRDRTMHATQPSYRDKDFYVATDWSNDQNRKSLSRQTSLVTRIGKNKKIKK